MFFRKKQSGHKSVSPVLTEFDFILDIMILDKIDTPSGTPIEVESHEDVHLYLAPPVENDQPVDIDPPEPIDTLPIDISGVDVEDEFIPAQMFEEISASEVEALPIEDAETPDITETDDLAVDTTDSDPVDATIDETTDPIDDDQAEPSETEAPVAETESPDETEIPDETEATNETEEPLDLAEEPIDETPEEIFDETEEPIDETPEEILDETEEPIDETPEEDTDEPEDPLDLAEDLPTESEVLGGFFTVGNDPVVAIDWLYDGGAYSTGQMGIFLLDGLDINSPDFATSALQRVTSTSEFGYVVINDAIEGAKFVSPENAGTYGGLKIISLQAGGTYAIVLIPNGTFEEALTKLTNGEELSRQLQPIFSLTTTNPGDKFSSGLLVDVTGDGNTFIMEDLSNKGYSDLDFNDIIFQVRGMNGIAVSLDELFDYEIVDFAKDWRTSGTGQAIMEYLLPYVEDMGQLPPLEIAEIPTAS